MLNIISLIIGVVALLLAVVSFIPFLGWGNWLVVPFALVGVLLGWMSDSNTGRNLCLFVVVVGVLRLIIGGGII